MHQDQFHRWVAALERSAREFVGRSPDLAARGPVSLEAERCPQHGPGCARVTYGCLRDHVNWAKAEPNELAAALLRPMLPS